MIDVAEIHPRGAMAKDKFEPLARDIFTFKKQLNAVILAHNYQVPEIQDVADYVGDSLGLAQQAAKTSADVIVFCGVHFMAETAKILNPNKIVVLPDRDAGCSLEESCPADKLAELQETNPNFWTIAYINCSAAVKALTNVICTSGNAVKIVEAAPKDKDILFVPDENLGQWVMEQTGRKMTLWKGNCYAHVEFQRERVLAAKRKFPDAKIVVHPESLREVRRFQCQHHGFHQVSHMNEWTPLAAVVYRDDAVLRRLGRQQIHHQIEARPVREAEDSGEAQNRGMERVRAGFEQCPFGVHLGLAIKGHGTNLRPLIYLGFRGAVHAATGGENQPAHAVPLGDLDEHPGGGIVDLQGRFVILLARRVAYDGRKLNNGFRAAHSLHHVLDVAAIAGHQFEIGVADGISERLAAVHQAVQHANFAAACQQALHQQRSDVTRAAHYQYPIAAACKRSGGPGLHQVSLQQEILDDAHGSRADGSQRHERQRHAPADLLMAKEQEVGGKENHCGYNHATENDQCLVAPGVGARVRVESVQKKDEREDRREDPKKRRVVLQKTGGDGVSRDGIAYPCLIDHRHSHGGDHAEMQDHEVRSHAGNAFLPLKVTRRSQHLRLLFR